jgi:hypothetical protein
MKDKLNEEVRAGLLSKESFRTPLDWPGLKKISSEDPYPPLSPIGGEHGVRRTRTQKKNDRVCISNSFYSSLKKFVNFPFPS